MGKNKQKKKKERERRVAQKKLAAAQKRAQEHKSPVTRKTVPKTVKITPVVAIPKTAYVATNKKSPFTQRRSGGG